MYTQISHRISQRQSSKLQLFTCLSKDIEIPYIAYLSTCFVLNPNAKIRYKNIHFNADSRTLLGYLYAQRFRNFNTHNIYELISKLETSVLQLLFMIIITFLVVILFKIHNKNTCPEGQLIFNMNLNRLIRSRIGKHTDKAVYHIVKSSGNSHAGFKTHFNCSILLLFIMFMLKRKQEILLCRSIVYISQCSIFIYVTCLKIELDNTIWFKKI